MSQEYVLNIYVDEQDKNQAVQENIAEAEAVTPDKPQTKEKKMLTPKVAGAAFAMVNQVFRYNVGMIATRTGNTDAQDKASYALSVVGKISAIAGAFAVNPILGGMAIVSAGIDILQRVDSFYTNKRWDDVGLAQERLRAGASYNRSRGGRGGY